MKTAEEFYREISESKELQEELKEVSDKMLEEFLKKHGCDATAKDFTAYARSVSEGELEDDGAEEVVGGIYSRPIPLREEDRKTVL
jgi:hypothetical protein